MDQIKILNRDGCLRGAVTRRAAVAGPWRSLPASRSAAKHLLQHVPVLRVPGDPILEHPRQLLGHGGDLLLPGTCPGHGNLLVNVRAPVLSLVPQRHRHQRGPGLLGKRGRAAHDPGGLAEELALDPAAGQVPFAQQGDQTASPQPLRQDPEPARAGRVRQDLHAQPLPERHEPVMQRFRAQPLRHCGDLPGAAEHDPGARVLPVAHVRQREDHPADRRQVPERCLLLASRPHPAQDLRRRDHRQPEYLQPVPQIRTHRVPREPPEIHNRCIRANHPRQVRPAATPHLSRQVTAIGRLLAPPQAHHCSSQAGQASGTHRKTELAKAFGR
jgi:hypothetical protein